MILATHNLLSILNADEKFRDSQIMESLVNCILIFGSKEDADRLLQQYLEKPFEFDSRCLLSIFKKFGDVSYAESIFNVVYFDDKLHEDADEDVLELIGYFRYEPVKEILAGYAFDSDGSKYYLQRAAALGLLHFDCSEYQEEIRKAIGNCIGKGLFPEFIPALVCKLPDQEYLLQQLYESGTEYASVDCNAGMILGFSLCDDRGRVFFKKALFNENWEAHSMSSGSLIFTYRGLKNLGISLLEIFSDMQMIVEPHNLSYALDVFCSLLRKRISDYVEGPIDSISDLYLALFGKYQREGEKNLLDLAEEAGLSSEASKLEELFVVRLTGEQIIINSKAAELDC